MVVGSIRGQHGIWNLEEQFERRDRKGECLLPLTSIAFGLTSYAEGEGFLRAHQALPRRSDVVLGQQPGAGLLWRKDRERGRLSQMAEGSEGVHQEEEQEPAVMSMVKRGG